VAVQVSSGATAQVSFPVTCLPYGEIRVSLNAADPTRAYRVWFPTECSDYSYYVPCTTYPLQPGFPALLRVPAGVYYLTLLDVPANCRTTGPNPASAAVTSGARTELVFDVACR
jgi:hypothetical protein